MFYVVRHFFCLIPIIVVVILTSKRNDDDDMSQVKAILATDNPTASPTFSEVVTPFMCEEAAQLDGSLSIVASTRGAPIPGDVPVCSGLVSNGFGAWFTFVGDGNVFDCTTCDLATNFDTQLSVFAGTCSKLQCVAANDQGRSESCDSRSRVEFSTNPGENYFIFVHGKREAEGQVVLSLNAVPQDNDSCDTAGPVLPSDLNEIIGNTWFAAKLRTISLVRNRRFRAYGMQWKELMRTLPSQLVLKPPNMMLKLVLQPEDPAMD